MKKFILSILLFVLVCSLCLNSYAVSTQTITNPVFYSKVVSIAYDEAKGTVVVDGDVNNPIQFMPMMKLTIEDPTCIGDVVELNNIFKQAIVSNGPDDPGRFDFQKAINIIKANDKLSITGILDHTVNRSNANYVEMSSAVTDVILKVLNAQLDDVTNNKFLNAIQSCFSNVKKDNSGNFLWETSSESNSTYIYNVLFAIQNKNTGAFIYGLLISLTVTANASKSKLLGITLSSRQNYLTRIQAIEVVKLMNKYIIN
jgi:hypothetical protein